MARTIEELKALEEGNKSSASGTSLDKLREYDASQGYYVSTNTNFLPYQGYFQEKEARDKATIERLKVATGNNFDESSDFESEWKDYFNNWRLERTNTPVGKTAKFQELYPQGQIMFVPHEDIGGGSWVARRSPEEPWKRIGGLGSETAAAFLSEESLGGVVGEAVGSRGGIGGALAGPVIGMTAGNVIRNIQQAPYEKYTPADIGAQAVETGVVGGLFNLALRGGSVGIVKNVLFPPVQREFRNETIRGAAKRGLMPLTEGQATTNPLEQAMYAQQTRVLEDVRMQALKRFGYGDEKGKGLRGELEEYVDKYGFQGIDDDTLDLIIGQETSRISATIKGLKGKELSYGEAGEELKRGLKLFEAAAAEKYNKLYKEAFDASDDVVFDITALKKAVDSIKREIYAKGKSRTEKVITATGIEEKTYSPDIPIPRNLEKGSMLDKVMEAIQELDPVISKYSTGGKVYDSFEQLKTLRTTVGELSWETEGYSHKVARDLYDELTKALDNPVSGNPDFVAAYKAAQGAYRTAKDVADLKFINKLDKADVGTYATYAKQVVAPGKYLQLDMLKNTLPEDSWNALRNAFLNEITQDPRLAANRLERWWRQDKKGLSLLLDEKEKDLIVNWSKTMRDLEKSLPYKVWQQKGQDLTARALQIVQQGNEADMRTLVRLAGGTDSPTANALRAGLVEHWLSVPGVRITDKLAGDLVAAKPFLRLIEDQEANQVLKALFRKEDWEWLKDIRNYATFIGDVPSAGAGIQVGEVASGIQRIGPEVAEKGVSQVYKAFKLPLGMRIMALFKDFSKNAKEINTIFSPKEARNIREFYQMMVAGSQNIDINQEIPEEERNAIRSKQDLPFEPEVP